MEGYRGLWGQTEFGAFGVRGLWGQTAGPLGQTELEFSY